MTAENSADAASHVATFAKLVQTFGWSQRGRLDTNVSCQKCAKRANGDLNVHGLDGFFVIDCPYTQRARGIVVDGKRYTLKSMAAVTDNLSKMVNSVVETGVHLHDSPDVLEKDLFTDRSTAIDTAIVAWYCPDYDAAKVQEWVRECSPSKPRQKNMIAFVWENTILDRLKSLETFRATCEELEFFYFMVPELSKFSPILAPEMLISSIQPFRYTKIGSGESRHGIFYFDVENPPYIRFLLKFIQSCFAQTTAIDIFAHCSPAQLTKLTAELHDQIGVRTPGSSRRGPQIELKALSKTIYEA